jgi:hypothetical protein
MDLKETDSGGKDWIHQAQDRDQWKVIANAIMNFRFQETFENPCVGERLAASQRGLSSMD